ISYFGIDADQLMCLHPALTRSLFKQMMQLFQTGTLAPLPLRSFDANQVVDAFRYMQQARQIGKVVVTYYQPIHAPLRGAASQGDTLSLCSAASYLVTGGLGGFGLRTAQWLTEKGARHLILLSRSGISTDEAQTAMAELTARGVNVLALACDITDRRALEAVIEQTNATMPPLKGIVHAAAVFEDGLAETMTPEQIERVLAPKILGALHLHELTLTTPLDFFVLYASATSLFGNPGQSNYVAANTWLEAMAGYRRHQGLPALCVRWGAISDAGFLARNEKIKDA